MRAFFCVLSLIIGMCCAANYVVSGTYLNSNACQARGYFFERYTLRPECELGSGLCNGMDDEDPSSTAINRCVAGLPQFPASVGTFGTWTYAPDDAGCSGVPQRVLFINVGMCLPSGGGESEMNTCEDGQYVTSYYVDSDCAGQPYFNETERYSLDCDSGLRYTCSPPTQPTFDGCEGDLNGSGNINVEDLAHLLTQWSGSQPCGY